MALRLDGPLADRRHWSAEACSIDKAMNVIGNRVSMLLVREAFYGTTRFADFVQRLGTTDAVASKHLRSLVENGILRREPYRDPGQRTRYSYHLTDKGLGLLPVLVALLQWGDEHLQPTGGPVELVDEHGVPVRITFASEPEQLLLRVNSKTLERSTGRSEQQRGSERSA